MVKSYYITSRSLFNSVRKFCQEQGIVNYYYENDSPWCDFSTLFTVTGEVPVRVMLEQKFPNIKIV